MNDFIFNYYSDNGRCTDIQLWPNVLDTYVTLADPNIVGIIFTGDILGSYVIIVIIC